MRAPNILIFLLTVILAFVGVWEHIGAPVKIPDFSLPLIGSSKELMPFLAAHSFWLVVAAWVLLAVGVMLPKQSRQKVGRPLAQAS
jgi:heme/copper-type cytochrome/quinol oxidase subunit 1